MTLFAYDLTRDLGLLHPRDLLQQLSASELMDWWGAYQAEPWGEQREDARSIFQARVIGSAFSGEQINSSVAVSSFVYEIYADGTQSPEFQEMLANVYRSNDQH